MAARNDETAEVNRLYWESDDSVARIGERLGLSRRALYRALEPLPVGASCPDCAEALVFPRRTDRAAGEAECVGCGVRRSVADLPGGAAAPPPRPSADGAAAPAGPEALGDPELEQEWTAGPRAPVDAAAAARRGRTMLIGGALLAGVAVGAVAGILAARR